jgi:hypothetical protein
LGDSPLKLLVVLLFSDTGDFSCFVRWLAL